MTNHNHERNMTSVKIKNLHGISENVKTKNMTVPIPINMSKASINVGANCF